MKIAMTGLAVALAALASGCTPDSSDYAPYYGPSQGYAYPRGYHSAPYYAPAPYGYRAPYGQPYGGAGPGPSITVTLSQ